MERMSSEFPLAGQSTEVMVRECHDALADGSKHLVEQDGVAI